MKVNGVEQINETKNVMQHNQGKNLNCHQEANWLAIFISVAEDLNFHPNHPVKIEM